ncbi:hypothetical protein [Corynebacterium lubricantis]|uniref:hypothetical protein n=1 Tax=Corynebacterium lubricantis TaxID=541095 RepID=UPI00037A3CB3|nr:hypothetical protein [Corynebacterium lubricantis]
MRLIFISCGGPLPYPELLDATGTARHPVTDYVEVSQVPTRAELKFLDKIAREELPVDPTPSLDEIAAQPDVAHLGTPGFAPQPLDHPVRVVVAGSDAALSAVLTRMMRADYLWMEIAYLPADFTSAAAVNWGLTADNALDAALNGQVRPVPTIRTDTSTVVAGSATLTRFSLDDDAPAQESSPEYIGEIVVDSDLIVLRSEPEEDPAEGTETDARFYGQFGARLVPMTDAPGIAAVPLVTPRVSHGTLTKHDPRELQRWSETALLRWRTRGKAVPTNQVDGARMKTGRAVQSGGKDILVTIDGVDHPRPLKRVTFYRHLRDMQAVRPE